MTTETLGESGEKIKSDPKWMDKLSSAKSMDEWTQYHEKRLAPMVSAAVDGIGASAFAAGWVLPPKQIRRSRSGPFS